jgi:quercetin dioxygenase-like cupin family protein
MKRIAIALLAMALPCSAAVAADGHVMLTPEEIAWGPASAAMPPGAEAVLLHGDPRSEGPFAVRLRAPSGYHMPPHMHSRPEVLTILSGAIRLGKGEAADRSSAKLLPAGSFVVLPPYTVHYVFVEDDVVAQINTTGPWNLIYVAPEDDPRWWTQ